ncbi:regulator of chromosome condensation [Anaeramoeba flamelloides]|uniref:Regulator of chromosome condensation n=1 Tax=Anaeramoeba flamelloides TaxID=1746091 RepID=A0AAV7YFS7_9EUKA|nr:regulator of chromosome condensation [Anaeramoeba flamelloides]
MSKVYYYAKGKNKWEDIQWKDPVSGILLPKNAEKIVDLSGGSSHALYLYESGKLLLCDNGQAYETKFEEENEKVLKFTSGFHHSMILTTSYNIYAASINQSGQCAIPNRKDIRPPAKVTWFDENGLNVHDVICGVTNTFFLCRKKNESQEMQGDGYLLYSCGFQSRNGNGTETHLQIPTYVTKNVERLFTGNYSYHFFIIKTNGDLFASGEGSNGKLGNKKQTFEKTLCPVNLPQELTTDDLLDLQCGSHHSLLLTPSGEMYACGSSSSTGLNSDVSEFTKLTKLSDHFITKISCGRTYNFALTSKNEIFCWGTEMGNMNSMEPRKMELPDYESFSNIQVKSSSFLPFLYEAVHQSLSVDLINLLNSEKFADLCIHKVNVHKVILQCRIGLEPNNIKQIFEEHFTKSEFESVLQWVYGEKRFGLELDKKMKQYFDIPNFNSKKLINDISKLYNDEDSKDFTIKIKNNDDEDDEDEDDEVFEEIPVHKCILYARSGLYRDMFQNIQTETNEVQDYSQKSFESLEIIIKYFYIENIHLTADDDPQLVVDELEDASEYYQLSNSGLFNGFLKNIKRQFKL